MYQLLGGVGKQPHRRHAPRWAESAQVERKNTIIGIKSVHKAIYLTTKLSLEISIGCRIVSWFGSFYVGRSQYPITHVQNYNKIDAATTQHHDSIEIEGISYTT